MHPQLTR